MKVAEPARSSAHVEQTRELLDLRPEQLADLRGFAALSQAGIGVAIAIARLGTVEQLRFDDLSAY